MPKCADPVLCYTGKTGRKFRHFSLASPTFKALHQTVFNCGKCIYCRKKRSYELAIRCVLHASLYPQNCFLTLTYDESRPGYHNRLQYSDIQKFKKRLRAKVWRTHKRRTQIFNVHEYGKNGKKHWHLVVFNHDFSDKEIYTKKNAIPLYSSKELATLWPFGFSTIGNVTEASAMYQSQYTQKDFKNGNSNNEKKSNSRHSGIGRDYFYQHYDQILRLGFIPFGGKKIPIPRYFLRLAHKHWSHFYEPSNFFDNKYRKRLYTPFSSDQPDLRLADLYALHMLSRSEKISELASEWEDFIALNLFNTDKPEFLLSAENHLYDLRNKLSKEDF